MRSSVLSETNDEVTRQRKLHEKFGDHERSLQEERSIDPDRFSSHSQTAKVRRRSSRCTSTLTTATFELTRTYST